jgi:hypothetical protein
LVLVDLVAVVVSGGGSVVVYGDEGVVASVVASLGGGAVVSDSGSLGVVMMVSGRHVKLLPLNITSARCTQLKPGKGKICNCLMSVQ